MNETITRRLFHSHMAATLPCLLAAPASGNSVPSLPPKHLIGGLVLKTSAAFDEMKKFYRDLLGMKVIDENEKAISFSTPMCEIRFEKVDKGKPTYHFAFNIPENRIESAYRWIDGRADFILPPTNLNDRGLPRAVVAFRHWNAHSLFFWDPAGNAVELIARHDLKNSDTRPFSTKSILEISEIGLVVKTVPESARQVKKLLGLKSYVGVSEYFEPVGSPHGLVLMMKSGQKMAFGQGSDRDIYPTVVKLAGKKPRTGRLKEYPYRFEG